MTRQLVDVMREALSSPIGSDWKDALVASLLTDGPAEHTIDCPTCEGQGVEFLGDDDDIGDACPDCTNGRQRVAITAEVKR